MGIRRLRWIASGVFAVFAACSNDYGGGSELPTNIVDAGTPLDAVADAEEEDAAVARPCDPTKPFGVPIPIPSLTSSAHDAVRLSDDELTGYVASDRPIDDGGYQSLEIFVTTRPTTSAAFGPLTWLWALGSPAYDCNPALTPDLLTMFIDTSRDGTRDIWMARRANVAVGFDPPVKIAALSTSADEMQPYVAADGEELWFSLMPVGSKAQIHRATITGGSVSNPVLVAELVNESHSISPVLTTDGRRIYYATAAAHPQAKGAHDIWTASRASPNEPFANAEPVVEVNTEGHESPTWISRDGCRLYLAHNVPGAGDDVYVATKPR